MLATAARFNRKAPEEPLSNIKGTEFDSAGPCFMELLILDLGIAVSFLGTTIHFETWA